MIGPQVATLKQALEGERHELQTAAAATEATLQEQLTVRPRLKLSPCSTPIALLRLFVFVREWVLDIGRRCRQLARKLR
eukprot:COSAG05_NODE_1221_length_5476_cov_72.306305_6_plen_79_part_00